MNRRSEASRFWLVLLGCLILALACIYISLTNGTFDLSVRDIVKTLLRIDPQWDHDLVVFDFRLPRIVIAALVGCGLGVAGAVLQGITRNGLADPGILGIHAAAGSAVVLFMFLTQGTVKGTGIWSFLSMPMFGWLGGFAAVWLLYMFARHHGSLDPGRLILVGIALGSGFGALTMYISLKMNPQDFEMATVWLSGSIYGANWEQVLGILPWLLVLIPVIWRKAAVLDIMQLHESSVVGLGVRVNTQRQWLLICCVGIISACVSVSGSIGFVGLIAPHIARRLVGLHYRYLVPVCGGIGMVMVLLGDFLGRIVFAPAELPVGIVISVIGVPYFVMLLYRAKRAKA